ncbi:adhesin, partial [Ralstonia solanacearum species complex bacterium KE056]
DVKGGRISPTGAGVGQDSGSASSTTTSGISGIAGNTAVRTGDAETGIAKIFDADKVQREINAQMQITLAFSQQAGQAVSNYVDK